MSRKPLVDRVLDVIEVIQNSDGPTQKRIREAIPVSRVHMNKIIARLAKRRIIEPFARAEREPGRKGPSPLRWRIRR